MHPAATAHPVTTAVREEPSRSRSASPRPTWGTTKLENMSCRSSTPPAIAQQEGVRVPRRSMVDDADERECPR